MNCFFYRRASQIIVLIFSLFLIVGCIPETSAALTDNPIPSPLPTASSTPPPTSVEQPESDVSSLLTAHAVNVTVYGGEDAGEQLNKDEAITLPVGERIKLDTEGRGVLLFENHHQVDIFGGSEILIDEAKQESGGSTYVRLKQIAGHLHVLLDEQAVVRLTLESDDSTITTLEQGTEFTVCYAPEKLTCIAVQQGVIEVTSANEERIYKKGDATYFTPGQPPQPPICIQEDAMRDWLTRKWGPGETEALGALVKSWPQEPCTGSIAEGPLPDAGNLPPSQGMVHIETGPYVIGSTEPDEYHIAQQEITLNEYWIDAYEVTNAQYQSYLDATGQPPPVVWPAEDGYPVKGVTWDAALAYCQWLQKRLPTEAEWEVAGRGSGPNPPIFPWGDDPSAGGAVDGLPQTETYEVGTMPFNQSTFGVYDLAGNVWEWVDEPYAPVEDGYQVLRGGRHGFLRELTYRQVAESNSERFVPYAGFRCASGSVQGE